MEDLIGCGSGLLWLAVAGGHDSCLKQKFKISRVNRVPCRSGDPGTRLNRVK
jgi:hypothetical protein